MSRRVLCLMSDHPEIQSLDDKCHSLRDHFEDQIKFLDKKAQDLQEKYKIEHQKIWDEILIYLREKNLLPADYVSTDDISISSKENSITFIKPESEHSDDCQCFIHQMLRSFTPPGK